LAGLVTKSKDTSLNSSNRTVLPELAPVALFVYRRPEHTGRLLDSLRANPLSTATRLYVFSDAPASGEHAPEVAEVRALVRKMVGFAHVEILERDINIGCAENIIDGVTRVLTEHDRVIVVEDDLEVSPHFLTFLNRALAVYRDRSDIISVSAASPPAQVLGVSGEGHCDVYLAPRSVPWGWGTWRDRWLSVDWEIRDYARCRWRPAWRRRMAGGGNDLLGMLADQVAGRIDSWNVRFNHAQAMAGGYSLYPLHSHVRNTGLDGTGQHCRAGDEYDVRIEAAAAAPSLPPDIQPDKELVKRVKAYHDEHILSLLVGTLPGTRQLIRAVKKSLGLDRPLLKRTRT